MGSDEATLPILALTMGDPAGIGPEICLKAVADPRVREVCVPVIHGDADLLGNCARSLGLEAALSHVPEEARVVDIPAVEPARFRPGHVDAGTGRAAHAFIEGAVDAVLEGRAAGMVTAPVNKAALHAAGVRHPGHTEILAHRTRARSWCMVQHAPGITCSFVTVHVGYAEVPSLLAVERVLEVIRLTDGFLRQVRPQGEARIGLCGLNPHAGENGLFGDREEERILVPAVRAARGEGIRVEGPLPPDAAFTPDVRRRIDGHVCLYHDQGHIPVKALAFESAVNVTLGLPIVRTSVDHGTALDIAWKGVASASSLIRALKLAACLTTAGS